MPIYLKPIYMPYNHAAQAVVLGLALGISKLMPISPLKLIIVGVEDGIYIQVFHISVSDFSVIPSQYLFIYLSDVSACWTDLRI